jgi:hypothetical protein
MGQLQRFAHAWPLHYANARAARRDLDDEGCGTQRQLSGRAVVGVRLDVEHQIDRDVTESELMRRSYDPRLTRPKGHAANGAHATTIAIDRDPVLSTFLEANARRADARMVEHGIAIGDAADLDSLVVQRDSLLLCVSSSRWNDENKAHGGSRRCSACPIILGVVRGHLGEA